jgi:hypothetical protein
MHRFGMMCKPSGDVCCRISTSSMGASPVRTLAVQELEKVWQASVAGFLARSPGLLAKYDPGSSSWKMCQLSGLEEPTLLPRQWPAWGMIVDGLLYPLRRSAPTIKGIAGGSWPTPTTRDYKDGSARSCQNVPVNSLLGRAVHWRTPSASDWKNRGTAEYRKKHKGQIMLQTQVQQWPSPAASQIHKKIRKLAPSEKDKTHGTMTVGAMGEKHPETIGGYLNPQWVAWLMGYPSEWTDLEPWVIQSCLFKRGRLLKNLSESKNDLPIRSKKSRRS